MEVSRETFRHFEFGVFKVLRSGIVEVVKRILTVGCEETRGSGLENLGDRGPEKLSVE
jgi:hypothetical protein